MTSNGKHILIVDDYPDALDIWALYLGSLGYQVSTAADGAAAIAAGFDRAGSRIALHLGL
jgi:CheY-like chemotaxis protein